MPYLSARKGILGFVLLGRGLGPVGPHAQAGPSAAPPTAAGAPGVTAFVNVSVIPMDRERVLAGQTVVVRGDQIVALGPAGKVRVPVGALWIDGRGKYLIPGLADMHAHLKTGGWEDTSSTKDQIADRSTLFRYLAEGVTTIRTMDGGPQKLALKAAAARGAILSPRLYVAIRPGMEGLAHLSARPDSAARLAKQMGFDLLKIYGNPMSGWLDSIHAAARQAGLPIAGHAPGENNLDAIKMDYTSVEHLLGFIGDKVNAADDAQLRATALALKQAGVWVCPTLNHITGAGVGFVRPPGRDSSSSAPVDSSVVTPAYQAIKALHEAGVGLLAGSDAMYGWVMPGHFVADELERLVAAGLTSYEALATATRNPAIYLGTLESTGTVAVRKRADLVLLAGNPLADIRQVAQPAGVMIGGRWLPRAELDQILAMLQHPYWYLDSKP